MDYAIFHSHTQKKTNVIVLNVYLYILDFGDLEENWVIEIF
jgi:hypothetical protein